VSGRWVRLCGGRGQRAEAGGREKLEGYCDGQGGKFKGLANVHVLIDPWPHIAGTPNSTSEHESQRPAEQQWTSH
jgi:hypothetical protein